MTRLATLLAVSLLLSSCAARAPHLDSRSTLISGIFSTMHSVEEPGDVIGMEIFITHSSLADEERVHVHFQRAAGVPLPPVLVEGRMVGTQFEFSIPGTGRFTGVVRRDELVGKLVHQDGREDSIRLPRKKSYWQ